MAARKVAKQADQTRAKRVVSAKQRPAPRPGPGTSTAAVPLRLPRVPKGKRPQFFGDAGVDQLFGIVTALAAELSVAFERIETLERILEKHGALHRSEIDAHRPDPAEAAARTVAREALIERVFQVLDDYAGPG